MRRFARTPAWRAGLVHIHCTGCGRDLDWAQPEFVAAHPEPRCWNCPQPAPPAVVHAEAEVLQVALEPANEAFLVAVAEAEEMTT
jgi:hypothetical protein